LQLMQHIVMCVLHNNISIRGNGAFLGLSSIWMLYHLHHMLLLLFEKNNYLVVFGLSMLL
jgi:hypothetical protein